MKNIVLNVLKVCVVVALLAGWSYHVGYARGSHAAKTEVARQATLENMVKLQPDRAFKVNMLVVLASHAADSDYELMDILMPYAVKMQHRLSKGNNL